MYIAKVRDYALAVYMSIQSPVFPPVDTVPETVLGLTIHGLSPVLRAPVNSPAESMPPLRFPKYFLSSLFSCPIYTAYCLEDEWNKITNFFSKIVILDRFNRAPLFSGKVYL